MDHLNECAGDVEIKNVVKELPEWMRRRYERKKKLQPKTVNIPKPSDIKRAKK